MTRAPAGASPAAAASATGRTAAGPPAAAGAPPSAGGDDVTAAKAAAAAAAAGAVDGASGGSGECGTLFCGSFFGVPGGDCGTERALSAAPGAVNARHCVLMRRLGATLDLFHLLLGWGTLFPRRQQRGLGCGSTATGDGCLCGRYQLHQPVGASTDFALCGIHWPVHH